MTHRLPLRPALAACVALGVLASGCGDRGTPSSANAGGTVVVAWRADPSELVPPLASSIESREIVDLVFDRLALIKPGGSALADTGFIPQIARNWRWSTDSLSVRFALDERARWHDGHPLRADDIVFSLSLYRDSVVASPSAADLANVDSVTAPDSLTVVAWFHKRTPLQFNDLVMNLVPVPAHLWRTVDRSKLIESPLARTPVGSGRFRLERWDASQQLVLAADTTHPRGRPALDRIIWRIAPDDQTSLARLLSGEIDVMDIRTEEQLARVRGDTLLRVEFMPGFSYGVVQFNLRAPGKPDVPHPVLANRAVRRALAMATDRSTIVRSTFGSLAHVAYGPFARAQYSADTTIPQLPFDPGAAARSLDSIGWRMTGSGVRAMNGRPLRISALVPTGSAAIPLATLLQREWRDVGVDLRIEPVDRNAFGAQAIGRRAFDVIMPRIVTTQGFASLPQSWGSAGALAGGRNLGGYSNPAFDAQVDSALATRSVPDIRAHLRAAYTTIVADAPAIFVYETRGAIAVQRRLVTPVLGGDGWWLHLSSWSVAPGQRLPRDAPGPPR